MTTYKPWVFPVLLVLFTGLGALLAVFSRRKGSQYAINTEL